MYLATPFWFVQFLQKNQLTALRWFSCMQLLVFLFVYSTLAIFMMVYLSVGLFEFILFGTLCAFCVWIAVSSFRLGKLATVISPSGSCIAFSLFATWDIYNANVRLLDVILEIL